MVLSLTGSGGQVRAAEGDDAILASLHLSASRRMADARKWLDDKDYKSLAQTAGGLRTLASLVQARGDDAPWQAATSKLVAAAGELVAAARAEDAAACAVALEKLNESAAAVGALSPTGKPLPTPPLTGGLRPVMLLMDGIRGDAKIDLIAGDVGGAKKSAYVLSELGRLVSNSSPGGAASRQEWPVLGAAFVEASLAAARSPATDAASVRQLMRGVSQRCDACHETR